jgi:hypothetical protein
MKKNKPAPKSAQESEPTVSKSPLSVEELTGFLTELGRASTVLLQASSLFALLKYLADGDNRVSHERRLRDVIAALNEVGTLGDSLINQAFGVVVDVEYELKRGLARVADSGKAVTE